MNHNFSERGRLSLSPLEIKAKAELKAYQERKKNVQ